MARYVDVSVTVNGRRSRRNVDALTLLVHYVREHERLTGTHVGCDTSNCGACTVLLDGQSVKSCTILAVQADGGAITTIEGLEGPYNGFTAVQEGFRQCHGLQCGYCTPGMIMNAAGLLAKNPSPTVDQIKQGMEDNLCRSGAHVRIIDAVHSVATEMKGGK